MKRVLKLIVVCLLIIACSNKKVTEQALKQKNIDSSKIELKLDSSLFPARNITSSDVRKFLPQSTFDYLDSSKKIPYTLLDSNYIRKFVQPVINDYAVAYFGVAKLISWQSKIWKLQPFIIQIDGDDYNGLVYIILNKENVPVSSYLLTGGPSDVIADSVYIMHSYLHSEIRKDRISSYKLYMYYWVGDYIKRSYNIDSIVYSSKILNDGTIETQRIDSVRYSRVACPKF